MQQLLERGANVNYVNDRFVLTYNYSALQCAAMTGNAQMVSLLLRHGADREYKGQVGLTPLQLAKAKGVRVRREDSGGRAGHATKPAGIHSLYRIPTATDLLSSGAETSSACGLLWTYLRHWQGCSVHRHGNVPREEVAGYEGQSYDFPF